MNSPITNKAFYLTILIQTLALIVFVIAIRVSDIQILDEMRDHHTLFQTVTEEYRSDVKLNKEAIKELKHIDNKMKRQIILIDKTLQEIHKRLNF